MARFNAKGAALLFVFLLAACSLPSIPISPTATPTQALSPAGDYVSGLSEVPPDKILLVLARSNNSGTGNCNFPVVEQAPLSFWYSSGMLEISSDGSSGWLSDESLLDVKGQEIKSLGFFGYIQSNDYSVGGGVHDEIYYIDHLPYTVSSMSFLIHSIFKDGTIIASVGDDVYIFEPNQSWHRASTFPYDSQPECIYTNDFRVTNFGFLDAEDVEFTDAPILPW